MYGKAWMNLNCLMLSETSQTHRDILYVSIYMAFGLRQHYRDRKQINSCQGLGRGERWTTKGHRELFFVAEETVLYFDCDE